MTKTFRAMVALLCFCAGVAGFGPPAAANIPDAKPAQNLRLSVPAAGDSLIARWTPFIQEASRRFGIAEDWIKAVIRMESGGQTKSTDGSPITSRAGAMGLMQLMPETWQEMRREYGLGADPYDPHDNVLAGTAYLRWLHEKFGFPQMFAAYNAGPGTVDAQSAGMRELPQETRAYVRGIASILGSKAPEPEIASEKSPVFEAASALATFTRPDGAQIAIDASTVTSMRAVLPNEFAPGVQTVLSMGRQLQGVLESPEKVAALLKSHGRNV